jgi:hypothetical protein
MKFVRSTAVLVLALFAVAACDEDDGMTDVTTADLAGSWVATQFQYSDNDLLTIDAVSDFDGSVTLDVQSSGAFAGQINVPNLTPGAVPISGTLSIDPDTDVLSVTFDAATLALVCPDPVGSPETCLFQSFDATYTLSGDELTFVNDDTSFDFPDALENALLPGGARGVVDATLTATFER